MASWISMDEVCRLPRRAPANGLRLREPRQAGSRARSGRQRRSLYRAEDVAGLAKRKQAGRKHETLAANTLFGSEPSIPTALCTFSAGRPYYRGRDAVTLAKLGNAGRGGPAVVGRRASRSTSRRRRRSASRQAGTGRCFQCLGQAGGRRALDAWPPDPRPAQRVPRPGGSAGHRIRRPAGPPARCICALRKAGSNRPGWPTCCERPWCLLVDHELTSSAFVARIAASTGASLPACLLAGLATLSGPLHGDASGRVQALFGEVERLGEDKVVAHYLSTGLPLPGFGHHLYPDGDPRAAALLALFEPPRGDRALHPAR